VPEVVHVPDAAGKAATDTDDRDVRGPRFVPDGLLDWRYRLTVLLAHLAPLPRVPHRRESSLS